MNIKLTPTKVGVINNNGELVPTHLRVGTFTSCFPILKTTMSLMALIRDHRPNGQWLNKVSNLNRQHRTAAALSTSLIHCGSGASLRVIKQPVSSS